MPEKIKKFDEPWTIIPVHPLPLVDAQAGDIPVVEGSPVLLNKKDDDGPKGTSLPGAALPSVPAHPPSFPIILPPPAKDADKDADKDAVDVVKSTPAAANSKTLRHKLLPLRAMVSL